MSGFRVCFFNNCIEKNQNKTHFEEGTSESLYYLAIIPPRIYATISVIKKLQHNFPKMRGVKFWNFLEFFQKFIRFGMHPSLSTVGCFSRTIKDRATKSTICKKNGSHLSPNENAVADGGNVANVQNRY